ncbi:Capsular polysaccharide biosynthesis protein CapD [Nymphon striatum]|nr:Capsular polysaccharide biosynthesis protein CapD [Nymphon striatum]
MVGPITVTHKEITRYFMSIPEAVQLVIQAGAMAKGGDVFVLDMGESVKITDLATKMISLAGLQLKDQYNPKGDIEVKYSGLRPGEKLYEELLIGDNVSGTKHSRIMQANEEYIAKSQLDILLKNLHNVLSDDHLDDIKTSLTKIVSGYTPWVIEQNQNASIDANKEGTEKNLTGSSVADKEFLKWLIPGLQKVGHKSSHITFLVPSQVNERQAKATIVFTNKVRAYNCQVALEGFAVSDESVSLLKRIHPEMVSISLPWARQIQGNERREIGLSSVIRQLESKDIKVIAPCGFSVDMKKLFILSGASFCHETRSKHG